MTMIGRKFQVMLLQESDLAKAIVGCVQGPFAPDCAFVARFGRGGRIDAAFPRAGSEPRMPSVSGLAEGRRRGVRRTAAPPVRAVRSWRHSEPHEAEHCHFLHH